MERRRSLFIRIRARCERGLLLALTASLLGSCGPVATPVEEAPRNAIAPDRVPIVLIPGISREVGAQLRGGSLMPFSALALRTDAERLANLGDPRFAADWRKPLQVPARLDLALRRSAVRGLQGLIDRLVREEGYLRGNPDQPLDKDYPENPEAMRTDLTRMASLFVMYYDWRRDLPETACLLAHRIARIRALTGAPRVHVVGHSLGGVLARYYARYRGRDVVQDRDCPLDVGTPSATVNDPGSSGIGRLVFLGAPHHGSAQAFRALLQDFNVFGVMSVGLRDAVFTMPVAWELLPFAGADGRVSLLVGSNGEERIALYEPRTWIDRGWLVGDATDAERRRFVEVMLARATRLHQRMQEARSAEDAVPRFIVGSGCRPTPARALVENGRVEFLSRSQGDHPLFSRVTVPGDGVVSLESALGVPASPTLTALTTCTGHTGYVEDLAVSDQIVQFLKR
jgi:pimeloyl-ACP methyl ester carboxylesterase